MEVAGLADLFKTALEAWEFVDAAQAQALNFGCFQTRLDNQRAVFLIWAQKLGFFSPGGYNKALDSPQLRARQIGDTLRQICLFFSNTNELVQRYGLDVHSGEVNSDTEADGPTREDFSSAIFRTRYTHLRAIIRGRRERSTRMAILQSLIQPRQKSVGMWKKVKWSIRDEKKADTLLAQITALVDDLEKSSRDIRVVETAEELAAEIVRELSEAALIEIEESSRDNATVVSSAASIRLRSIEARTIDTALSSDGTFVTAQTNVLSHLSSEGRIASILEVSQDQEESDGGHIDFSTLEAENRQACAKLVANVPYSRYSSITTISEEPNFRFASRVLLEMRERATDPTPNGWFTVAPVDEFNLDKFLGTIIGPAGTPYEGGIFHLRVNLSGYYPFRPPEIWFVTRILHPNIDTHGAIYTDLLGSQWSPSFTLESLLVSVTSILDEPIWDDPVRETLASEWTSDQDEFKRRARDWTRKYATGHIIFPGERADGFYTVSEMAGDGDSGGA